MAIAPERMGIGIRRLFTTAGLHPYDTVTWERRDARITNYTTGAVAFEQLDVEVPSTWSVNATNILAQKYFRGTLGTSERESSLKQVVDRVVDTITEWGRKDGYFFDEAEADAFSDELRYLIIHQKAAFNSPVWFNIGVQGVPAQASACQPYDALVCTDDGLIPIGKLVESNAVGTKVYDAHGLTKIVAVKANGQKPVLRIHTKAGVILDVTPDHLVWRASDQRYGKFVPAGDLKPGDHLEWHRTETWGGGELMATDPAEAALAGWLQSDGFVGQYTSGTNRSLTIEAMTVTPAELAWVTHALDLIFPGVHRHERSVATKDEKLDCRRTRLYGAGLAEFVDRWGLRARGVNMTIPARLYTDPLPTVAAYLRSMFQAEGYVSVRERAAVIGLDMISEDLVRGMQALLARFGIFSRVRFKQDSRADRKGCWSLSIRNLGDRRRFADEIGFIDPAKAEALERSFALPGQPLRPVKHLDIDRIEELGVMDVYDIQTESGEYLSSNLRVHNCFILSVKDSMSSILNWYTEEGTIFKGGSGAGINLSRIRSSKEGLRGGGTASGPVSFMRGADASAGTIKSGGKTRRAAKMVILNVDHPDVEDFIWCKAIEERKARALRDAGFDMDLDGKDSYSIQYQNANNSVRVTDDFMQAVLDDDDWHLRAVTTGEIVQTMKARDLFRQISKAAWECADPGVQFDSTINKWHTAPNTGRINGSNPCCFVGETLVVTNEGLLPIAAISARCDDGDSLPSVRSMNVIDDTEMSRPVVKAWVAGYTSQLVEVKTTAGGSFRCTAEHRFLTRSGAWVEARDLQPWEQLRALGGEDAVAEIAYVELDEEVPVYDLEVAGTHNFAVAIDETRSVVVHNSEYMHLDNSACNLASLNLLTFLNEDGSFDVEGFKAATEVIFTAQEILVGNADYPTESIAETSRRFRQLGIGYANLGALLMAQGLPYDSDEGRAWAAAITALLTGHAYATSARTAARMGPFAGFTENRDAMLNVLRMHRSEVASIDEELVPTELLSAAQEAWDTAVDVGEQYGVRNSQASVLAPTGCLVGGSLVTTERGLVRLRSLGDPEGPQWQDLGLGVATDDGVSTATRFYVNGLEPVVTVDTRRGHRIQGTPQHRIKVVDPQTGAWEWKRFGEVGEGDLVPLAFNQLVGEPTEVLLPPLPEAYWAGEHNTDVTRTMTPALAELVGYFMGNGQLHSRGLRFRVSAGDDDVVEWISYLGKVALGLQPDVIRKDDHSIVRFDSVRLALWWEACGFAKLPAEGQGPGRPVAHVPDAVLHANDPSVYGAFVRGLFEAAGNDVDGYPAVTSRSVQLVHDVQSVLLALGYPTALTITEPASETDTVDGQVAELRLVSPSHNARWLGEIGFMSYRKNDAVTTRSDRKAEAQDWIPVTRAMVERLADADERLRRTLLAQLDRGKGLCRLSATELFERTGDLELGHLLSFVYDRVSSAELGQEEFTYDLSVPDNVTYVANGFISHNTIGLLMDCDTTGIEPDLGLVKTKKLVGGGTMSIVNQTVPRALRRLGYSKQQIEAIIAYIDEHKSIVGAPELGADDLPIFACSMGDNVIHFRGHIRMMGAVQPWISGSISKTANLPEEATIEDIEQLYIESWQLGLKAVAVYRDNCKVGQPLAMTKKALKEAVSPAEAHDAELAVKVAELEKALERQTVVVKQPIRERLPRRRRSSTFKFRVADCEGYVTVGEYEDGRPGELFIKVAKQGSTLAGIMDSFAISVSLGLQHGVPLSAFVKQYVNVRFEPAGMTDDPDLRIAASLVDYIFRRMAVDYLPFDERSDLGILTTGERLQPTLPGVEEMTTPSSSIVEAPPRDEDSPRRPITPTVLLPQSSDAPYCYQCGIQMQRAGSCFACSSCGTTSGCS